MRANTCNPCSFDGGRSHHCRALDESIFESERVVTLPGNRRKLLAVSSRRGFTGTRSCGTNTLVGQQSCEPLIRERKLQQNFTSLRRMAITLRFILHVRHYDNFLVSRTIDTSLLTTGTLRGFRSVTLRSTFETVYSQTSTSGNR